MYKPSMAAFFQVSEIESGANIMTQVWHDSCISPPAP